MEQVADLTVAETPSGDAIDADAGALARAVRHATGWADGGEASYSCPGPVYVALRAGGTRRYAAWSRNGDFGGAIADVWRAAARQGLTDRVDAAEICLSFDDQRIRLEETADRFANRHRGLFGIEIALGAHARRLGPTEMIARNLSFERALERFLSEHDLSQGEFVRRGGRLIRFRARQVLVTGLDRPIFDGCNAAELHRGGRVVEPTDISTGTVSDMVASLGGWLAANTHADGRMTYKYWPSRGEPAKSDNPIRQFMASVALRRFADHAGRADLLALADRNLAANLDRFYRLHDGIGVIEHDGQAKLGAAALAALAILESGDPQYDETVAALDAGIEALWQADGSFRSFHFPAERAADNQNFYPGEALLYWAMRLERDPDPDRLAKAKASFAYYRAWHRRAPNPAFVPWHAQAYAVLHDLTGEAEFAAFVFEMTDWLLPLQQFGPSVHADQRGRFYDPKHPDYGPSHASSTGVYLEGLAAALKLANAVGDATRAARYREAVWRGIRNLRQLQFKDETDMFYIARKDRVRGGVRTECYDNTIRVDNVQHGLMALLGLTALPEFAAAPARTGIR